jgi:hypothetical protein
MERTYKFEFKGLIHPSATKVNYGPVSSPFKSLEMDLSGRINFEVSNGQVLAGLESQQNPVNSNLVYLGCIGEIVLLGIYPYLDVLGYVNGLALSVELIEAKGPGSDQWLKLPIGVPVIKKRTTNTNEKVDEILSLYDSPKGWYIQKALSDLRNAIRHPGDTGFFCYRAIETLASYFKDNANDDINKKIWNLFKGSVGVSREEIDIVKEYADVSRHGFVVRIPTEKRAELFTAACNIVDKYIKFGRKGYDGRVSPIEKI